MAESAVLGFHIVTLFPEMVEEACRHGVVGRALERGRVVVTCHQLRSYCGGSIHDVDDAPYGGGPGMVMRPEPIFAAVQDIEARFALRHKILLTPQGRRFDQAWAQRLSTAGSVLLLCGRYEGVDERVRGLFDEELSLGDFVLSGGEPAAVSVIDACTRLVPGVLGCEASLQQESFSSGGLEYPQYTRPEVFRGMRVPAVLTSGDHARIRAWREHQASERTRERRPDLLERREKPERS